MCGRFVVARKPEELAVVVDATVPEGVMLPERSWNVAPTDVVPIVVRREIEGEARRELHPARWGLIPPWASDASGAAKMMNARIETVTQKRAFAEAVRSRRCLVPADGYYEWQRQTDRKRPFYIHSPDDGLIYFAGIYSWWADPQVDCDDPKRWTLTVSVLTCSSAGELVKLHDRMPVALTADTWDEWLRSAPSSLPDLLGYVQGVAKEVAATWTRHAVTSAVGSVRNNGPQLIDAVAP